MNEIADAKAANAEAKAANYEWRDTGKLIKEAVYIPRWPINDNIVQTNSTGYKLHWQNLKCRVYNLHLQLFTSHPVTVYNRKSSTPSALSRTVGEFVAIRSHFSYSKVVRVIIFKPCLSDGKDIQAIVNYKVTDRLSFII